MRFYLDTEFNSHNGELISLALSSEFVQVPMAAPGHLQSHEWYAAKQITQPIDPWVRENVLPVLRCHFMPETLFRYEFQKFLRGFPECEVICDWYADAAHFCCMLAGSDYATSMDFPCTIRILKTPPGKPVSNIPHNALEDARALRDWHESFLKAA